VLERQSDAVRRLLLRTSILERVSGPLADGTGGERTLQELEETNAFVVPLDAVRSWFRYHHLFADLLQLELRRAAPGEVTDLHRAATSWFAGHGHPVEAVRHAQAAQDWSLASRLLADHWPGLQPGGQAATVYELLAGFPAELGEPDRERGETRTALAALRLAQDDPRERPAPPTTGSQPPLKPLSVSEIRVLRYLPTNLSTPEIANELHISRNTVRTHMSHLYVKLGTHRRTEAVERARALGLLAPLARRR
jgi:ATP/maltotriose-dependent transcriptional regulator MalT